MVEFFITAIRGCITVQILCWWLIEDNANYYELHMSLTPITIIIVNLHIKRAQVRLNL